MIRSARDFVELRARNDVRATHDSAPESVWLEVIRDHPDLKEWVVHNKTVPVSLLRTLARDPDPRVRCSVAAKRKCPPDLLEELARDPDETVRVRVAWNGKTPSHVLRWLRDDSSTLVSEAIACRKSEVAT